MFVYRNVAYMSYTQIKNYYVIYHTLYIILYTIIQYSIVTYSQSASYPLTEHQLPLTTARIVQGQSGEGVCGYNRLEHHDLLCKIKVGRK